MSRSDGRLEEIYIHVECHRVDIDKYRGGPDPRDATGGGKEGIGGGDDLVARADILRHQADEERVGAGRDTDSVASPRIGSHLLLERHHAVTENEFLRVEYLLYRPENVAPQRRKLEV